MLTKEQVAFYRENGYIGVENVLSAEEVEALRKVTDEFVEKSRLLTENDEFFDLEPDHAPQAPRLRRIKRPASQHPVYDRTLRHDRILEIVAQLIGPAIRYNGDKLNMKSAEFGSKVEWHQDWAFYPHTNDDLLAVGVALDDMSAENGCLLVLPGSHKGKVYDHHHDGRFAGAVTEADFDDSDAVRVELKAGGISIHHARTLHGSLPNTSNQSRRLLLFQYCAADAWPLLKGNWDEFSDMLLRGELTCAPRLEPVPVRLPLPPAVRQGSIYEVQGILERSTFNKVASG
jgi:ectoine hydroxylase-related dioxygenase (phytanoyl-CoA dioxygenase family)